MRLGRERAVTVFAAMLVLAYVALPVIWALSDALDAWLLLPLVSAPLAVPLARTLSARRDGPALNQLLADTGRLLAVFSVLLAAGLSDLVVKRDLFVLSLPFREPFVTATGVISERWIVLLRLEDEDGAVGWGEAAPFEPYDGVSVERVEAVLRGRSREELRQAEAAVEMALLDLDARREGPSDRRAGRDRDPGEPDPPSRARPRRWQPARRRASARATSASS